MVPERIIGNSGIPYGTDGLVVVVVWANTGVLLRSESASGKSALCSRFSSKLRSSNQPCLLIKGFMYNHVQTTCSGHSYFSTWSIFGWCLWGQMFAGTFPQVAFSSHSVSLNVKPWGWKSQRSWNATAGQMFRGIWTTSILFGLLA